MHWDYSPQVAMLTILDALNDQHLIGGSPIFSDPDSWSTCRVLPAATYGLPLDADGLSDLAKKLKQRCGAGGTVRNGAVEIQGDHRDMLMEELSKLGYTVKRSGG